METQHHFDPREERHVKEELPRRVDSYKRPWYNQGWVWLIFAIIALGIIAIAIFGLSDQVANVNGSIREQTAELHQQNGILASLSHNVNQIASVVQRGIDRIVQAINDLKN